MRLVIPRRNHTIVGRRKIVACPKALQKIRIVYRYADQVFLMQSTIGLADPIIVGQGILEPLVKIRIPKIRRLRRGRFSRRIPSCSMPLAAILPATNSASSI